jgi:hypothetical protein
MERRFFRSTSTEHLLAELRQRELLRDAALSGQGTHRLKRTPAQPSSRRALGQGLRMLVRRMAG